MTQCQHFDQIKVKADRDKVEGCEVCLATGGTWVHLRQCLTCGHVGCCDSSPGKHARVHFGETGHALAQSVEPDETWAWCFVDELLIKEPPQVS